MTTPLNPAFKKFHPATPVPNVQPKFADHLDAMFGGNERRWLTGDHVEVIRQAGADGKRIFRKSFLREFSNWTEREHLLLFALKGQSVAHIQVAESYSARKKFFESLDAGPDLMHWLDLPVRRDDLELDHIFQDCAHWFSLARWSIEALEGIHEKACVHLDIKADNLCLPCQLGNTSLKTQVLPDWQNLRLIDFAFSVWERITPLTPQTPLIIGKATTNRYQSKQLLHAVEADSPDTLLARARKLDWRCDLYSLGYLLTGILDHLPTQYQKGSAGWNKDRLEAARALADKLLGFDDDWQKNPERLPKLPHSVLLQKIDWHLADEDLKQHLTARWNIVHRDDWQTGRAGLQIPITKLAKEIKIDTGPSVKTKHGKLAGFVLLGSAILGGAGFMLTRTPAPLPTPEPTPAHVSSMGNKPAVDAVEQKHRIEVRQQEDAARKKAQLPAQVVDRLLKAEASQFGTVAKQILPGDETEAGQVMRAVNDLLFASWSKTPFDNPARTQYLERLLWLHNTLPAAEKGKQQAQLAAQYAKESQAIEHDAWWKSVAKVAAGPKETAWLRETKLLANDGYPRAEYTLGTALLTGKQGKVDSAKAGEWYARALKHDADANSTEQSSIIGAILRQVDAQALVGNDRQFVQSIIPGLQYQSSRNNPAASWLLANILACRVEPPRYDDARKTLEKLSQISDWRTTASGRMKTIDNPQWCNKFSRAAKG